MAPPQTAADVRCQGVCSRVRCCGCNLFYWHLSRSSDQWTVALFSLASLALMAAALLPLAINALLESGINHGLVVDSTSSPGYDAWMTNTKDGDVIVYYNTYFFDLQNADEVAASSAKPVLVERGPFVYREFFQRWGVDFDRENGHASFGQWTYYVQQPDESMLGQTDDFNVTATSLTAVATPYLIAQAWNTSAAAATGNASSIAAAEAVLNATGYTLEELVQKVVICSKPDGATPFWRRNVRCVPSPSLSSWSSLGPSDLRPAPFPIAQTHRSDLYFGYFNDPMLVSLKAVLLALSETFEVPIDLSTFTTSIPGLATNYSSLEDSMRRTGINTVYTGGKDIRDINRFVRYQNMTQMHVCLQPTKGQPWDENAEQWPACWPFQTSWTEEEANANGYFTTWTTPFANRISGTDGSLNRHPAQQDLIEMFLSDIYRTVEAGFFGVVNDFYDLKLNRYGVRSVDLQNASVVPANAAYNQYGPEGLANFTSAAGFPLFASKPHFLDAAPELLAAVDGLLPIRDAHDTFLDLEPNTGVAMRVHERLMASVQLTSYHWPSVSTDAINNRIISALLYAFVCNRIYGDLPRDQRLLVCAENRAMIHAIMTELQSCLAEPVHWNITNDMVFLPFAWADENGQAFEKDATDIKTQIYATQEFIDDFQSWGFIVAGAFFLCALVLIYVRRLVEIEVRSDVKPSHRYAEVPTAVV